MGARDGIPADSGHRPGRTSPSRARAVVRVVVDRLTAGDGTFERPPASDVLLAVVLLVPAGVELAIVPEAGMDGWLAAHGLDWAVLVLLFAPLVWRRVSPTTTIALTGFGTGIASAVLGYETMVGATAVIVALYSVSAYGCQKDGRWSVAITLGFTTFGAVQAVASGSAPMAELALSLFAVVGVWSLGERTRQRREILAQLTARAEEAERTQELAAELAVADERTRIARELHDVVAHAVSVVVVQAGAGRHVAASSPDRAVEALAAIEATGRGALIELRRLVGVLREDVENDDLAPQPSLDDLPELIERLADTGIPVRLRLGSGVDRLPAAVQVSAYRIVQEALTNVLKHAGAVTRVEVTGHREHGCFIVAVRDDGRGVQRLPANPTSAGITGMRERVALFGGTLHAGSGREGGFHVRATLPTAERPEPELTR